MLKDIDTSMLGSTNYEHKQIKATPAYVRDTTEQGEQGLVTAIFSVFGNMDSYGDIMQAGSFKKTFSERGNKVKVLDNHKYTSTTDIVAKITAGGLRELSRDQLPAAVLAQYPDATGGAEFTAQFDLSDPKSAAVYRRIKAGWIDGFSFGFNIIKWEYEKQTDDDGNVIRLIRHIKEVLLWEVSPVVFPANQATITTDVRAEPEQEQPSKTSDDTTADTAAEDAETVSQQPTTGQPVADNVRFVIRGLMTPEYAETLTEHLHAWRKNPDIALYVPDGISINMIRISADGDQVVNITGDPTVDSPQQQPSKSTIPAPAAESPNALTVAASNDLMQTLHTKLQNIKQLKQEQ